MMEGSLRRHSLSLRSLLRLGCAFCLLNRMDGAESENGLAQWAYHQVRMIDLGLGVVECCDATTYSLRRTVVMYRTSL